MKFEYEGNPYTYPARVAQMRACVPEFFDVKRLLNVGVCPGRTSFLEFFANDAETLVVNLEIYEPFSKQVAEQIPQFGYILGDARKVDTLVGADSFDAVLWFHGPEHIDIEDLKPTLEKLERIAPLVICGCPFGIYHQDGGDHEIHKSHLYPGDFLGLGYEVSTLGEQDTELSNLLAWKRRA